MFSCDNDEKIFQTLPGQGWRVLIQWNADTVDSADGFPAMTLEPVIAWVTAKIPRGQDTKRPFEDVIIAPLVRWPSGDELVLMDSRALATQKLVYVAPGEKLSEQHFEQLGGGYAKGVPRV